MLKGIKKDDKKKLSILNYSLSVLESKEFGINIYVYENKSSDKTCELPWTVAELYLLYF
jgi:hypothetical protein